MTGVGEDLRPRPSRWAAASIALLALVSSIAGIVNGFAYDDRYIVQLNGLVRGPHGWWRTLASPYWPVFWGGDGYRPLTILAFKIEYAIGAGRPVVFHATNIALYTLVCVLVYQLARRVLPSSRQWPAWLAAALFAVHPVHVEAVANVVGQSELIVAAALVAAILLYLRDRCAGPLRPRTAVAIAVLYAIGCFAKEHAIVLPALLGAAELILIDDPASWTERVRRLRPICMGLALVAVAMLAARSVVLADHGVGGFEPFTPFSTLHISNRDRVFTALGVVPEWIRLLYWPAHLASEYGPPEIEIAQGFSVAQLPGALLLVAIVALGIVLRRRQRVISFGIAFVCLALLPSSNFVLPAGIVLAERTLFLPSVGAMLIAAALAELIADAVRVRYGSRRGSLRAAQAVCALVLMAGVVRSTVRTRIWHDNDRLFHQAVIDLPRSYRAHYMLGALELENKRKRDGFAELRTALKLFPYDPSLAYNIGEQYRNFGNCDAAMPFFRWSLALTPTSRLSSTGLAWCLLSEGHYDEAKQQAMTTLGAGGDTRTLRQVIFLADSVESAVRAAKAPASMAPTQGTGRLPEPSQKTRGNAWR